MGKSSSLSKWREKFVVEAGRESHRNRAGQRKKMKRKFLQSNLFLPWLEEINHDRASHRNASITRFQFIGVVHTTVYTIFLVAVAHSCVELNWVAQTVVGFFRSYHLRDVTSTALCRHPGSSTNKCEPLLSCTANFRWLELPTAEHRLATHSDTTTPLLAAHYSFLTTHPVDHTKE
jgi:hypothetical protein